MTSPIVILEGPDGAGKSTLARQLSDLLEVPVMHLGPPPEGISALDQCLSMIMNNRTQYMGAVMDRFHIGERIYGPLMRGVDTLGYDGQYLVEEGLLQLGAKMIVCLPPVEVCLENWRARKGAEYVQEEDKIHEIHSRYLSVESRLPTLVYDYTKQTMIPVLEFLEFLEVSRDVRA